MNQFRFITVSLFVLIFSGSFAQDVIHLIDGTEIKAKVVEINPQYVIYEDYNNPSSPTYLKKRAEVSKIVYENGKVDNLQGETTNVEGVLYGRNLFGYCLSDVLFNDFTLFYEYISKNQKVGFKIPFSMGYDIKDNPDNLANLFSSGFGINFYPTGQGKWKYFMGPNIKFGLANYYQYYYYWDPNIGDFGSYVQQDVDEDFFYFRMLVDNGIIYSPIKNFCISGSCGLGVRYFDLSEDYDGGSKSSAHVNLNICYRFK